MDADEKKEKGMEGIRQTTKYFYNRRLTIGECSRDKKTVSLKDA